MPPAGFRGRACDQSFVEHVAAGHEDGALAVLHFVGVVPHADFVAGEVGRIDGQHQVAAVGQDAERLGYGRRRTQFGQVGRDAQIHDGNAVIQQVLTAVDIVGVGAVRAHAVEVLLVGAVNVRRNEEGQLPLGFEVFQAFVRIFPEIVEHGDRVGRCVHGVRFVIVGIDLVVVRVGGDGFEKSVEGVRAAFGRRVAHPHRRADAFGDGLFEERGFGLFEFGAREILHIDLGTVGNQLIDQREVVCGRVAQFGFHAVERDGFLEFFRAGAAAPACRGEFLQDVGFGLPHLHCRRYGHVVKDADAQVDGRRTAQHRAEKDRFEVFAGVGFGIFECAHEII